MLLRRVRQSPTAVRVLYAHVHVTDKPADAEKPEASEGCYDPFFFSLLLFSLVLRRISRIDANFMKRYGH